jgi:hypothetical protein
MFVESLSLPFCLIEKIYCYIPKYFLCFLSKSHFNKYIDNYFTHCKSLKNGRFFYNKLNNTYIRYLIRNNMYIFINYLICSPKYVSWNSIKRFKYKNKVFKTYLDYCIYLANEYESEKTKELLVSSINTKRKRKKRKETSKS